MTLWIFVAYCSCYCLLEAISHYAIALSECNNRIHKPTTNSADFDPIFPDLSPLCFGTWSVVQRLSRKALNGLECYSELARDHTCALKAAKSFDAVDWREVKLSLLCPGKIGFLFLVPGITDSLCLHYPCQLFSARVKVVRGGGGGWLQLMQELNDNFVSEEENGPGPGK